MEYVVLARKWRPQTFEDVIGQDHVVRTLQNALRSQRIAHAYLFSGPRGTGKTSVARILSKALNCESGLTGIPCNCCTNCREITDGTSLDVREIDGASNRGIDEIRELRENIKFSPVSSRYKIFIIDEVHMLTKEAFNALLKTLEEPPAHVLFIFATTENHKVPVTILSRCQHFDFRRISVQEIARSLMKIAEAEDIKITDNGIMWVAQGGDGSLRDAQSIFDQVISYAGTNVHDNDIEDMLGRTQQHYLFDIAKAVIERNPRICLEKINESYYAGIEIRQLYQMLMNYFMNLLTFKITGNSNLLTDLSDHELATVQNLAKMTHQSVLQRHIDILVAQEDNIKKSQDPRINLEFILVKMAYIEPMMPFDEYISRLEALERNLRQEIPLHIPKKQEINTVTTNTPTNKGNESTTTDDQAWSKFIAALKAKHPILCSKMEHGTFLGFDKNILSVGFPEGYVFLDNIREELQQSILNSVVKECFQNNVTVNIKLLDGKNPLQQTNENQTAVNGDEIRTQALNHPLLQKIMDVFEGAEVRDIKLTTKN